MKGGKWGLFSSRFLLRTNASPHNYSAYTYTRAHQHTAQLGHYIHLPGQGQGQLSWHSLLALTKLSCTLTKTRILPQTEHTLSLAAHTPSDRDRWSYV